MLLTLSIVANVAVLAVFKYFNFLAENINIFFSAIHITTSIPLLNILLPIGLSFHTFQAMSYTIEVYRGKQMPEKHFGIYALYVMFYPQLVAGPIERPQNMIFQFHKKKIYDYEKLRTGLILIGWGLIKKVVIADRLALFVNQVFNNPTEYKGMPLIIASVFFAFQIFCDFSGYSDIAIGTARCMGFNLMENFNRPYQSKTIGEFWRRWHISLSTWFRDYVFIPLGGSRVKSILQRRNLLIVFLLSGVWHGANWTFLVWGAIHGFYLIIENAFYNRFDNLRKWDSWYAAFIKRSIVFSLVTFSWIFFRAQDLSDSMYIVRNLFINIPYQFNSIITNEHLLRLKLLYLGQSGQQFFLAIIFISLMMFIHYLQKNETFDVWLSNRNKKSRWFIYYSMVFIFIFFGVFNRSDFIYFQF